MNKVLLVIFVLAISVWSYIFGTYHAVVQDGKLDNMQEVQCDDITRSPLSDTLVCEIHMNQEDDNIIIYRGEGSYGDQENN